MIRTLLVLAFVLITPLAVFAQDRSADEMKIIGMENLWNSAQRDHDTKAMKEIVAENFIDVEPDGSFKNKAEFLGMIKDPNITHTVLANSEMKVWYYGNSAVVEGNFHDKGTDKGKPFEFHAKFIDTWVLADGKWRCVASHSTPVISK